MLRLCSDPQLAVSDEVVENFERAIKQFGSKIEHMYARIS
jgi:hypothetical protein